MEQKPNRNGWNATLKSKCEYLRDIQDKSLIPNCWFIFFIDGKNFSSYLKKYKRPQKPFSDVILKAMDYTLKNLCENIPGVRVGYTQSDEITLLAKYQNEETGEYSDPWYGGRVWKLVSLAASYASVFFNQYLIQEIAKTPASAEDISSMLLGFKAAVFDCKVWNVSEDNDAYAWLSERNIDCIRNSKNQVAQAWMSHKSLLGKSSDECIQLLEEQHGVSWNKDFSEREKYGSLAIKREVTLQGPDGDYTRKKWFIEDGFPMMGQEGVAKFKEFYYGKDN